MSDYSRADRIGVQIQEEVAGMIMSGKIKDPRVSTFLTVNHVEVSGDFSVAKVYVSSFMEPKDIVKGVAGLNSASGFIQSVLGKKLRLLKIPKLTFLFDDSIKTGISMVQKITEVTARDREIAENNPYRQIEPEEQQNDQ